MHPGRVTAAVASERAACGTIAICHIAASTGRSVSIGSQKGPLIGVQKGSVQRLGDRGGSGMIARVAAGWGIENWGGFCTGRRLRAGFHLTPIIEEAE
jgi:hypothetical protein